MDYVYRFYRNKVKSTIDYIFRTSFVINFVVNVWRKYLVALYEFISYQSKIISLQCSDCMNNILNSDKYEINGNNTKTS